MPPMSPIDRIEAIRGNAESSCRLNSVTVVMEHGDQEEGKAWRLSHGKTGGSLIDVQLIWVVVLLLLLTLMNTCSLQVLKQVLVTQVIGYSPRSADV